MGACNSIQTVDLKSKYRLTTQLGIGSFSIVKLGTNKQTGGEVAVKCIDKRKLPREHLQMMFNEAKILQEARHTHIVRMIEMFQTCTKLYIVLEYLKGGSLYERVVQKKKMSPQQVANIVCMILEAVKYCHDNNVCHRDIKPENIIFQDEEYHSLKITDFGLAEVFATGEEEYMTTPCGSPSFVAPEVLSGKGYTRSCDMWSVGIILYTLLCGYPPFYANTVEGLFRKAQTGEFVFLDAFWGPISDDAKDLVSKLLTLNTSERYTAQEALDHPFIQGCTDLSTREFDDSYYKRLQLFGECGYATWEFMVQLGVEEKPESLKAEVTASASS